MKKLFSILLFLHSVSGAALASDWKNEVNNRWGFSLSYPESLIPEAVPTGAFGSHTHPDSGESLNDFWKKELADRGDTVTYKLKKEDFYVVSGVNQNGYEFYHKVFFYPTYWVEFEITYPHSKRQKYDAWV